MVTDLTLTAYYIDLYTTDHHALDATGFTPTRIPGRSGSYSATYWVFSNGATIYVTATFTTKIKGVTSTHQESDSVELWCS